ncbi:MAG: STAS domain-containing protein [Candidatus Polarisedimenticolia bacterium]
MAEVRLLEESDAFAHVAVHGNLDEGGVGRIQVPLTSLTVGQRKPVILDMTEVGFMTSLGIGLLVSIARSMRTLGHALVLVAGPTPARKALEITNIGAAVPLVTTRDEALRALGLEHA